VLELHARFRCIVLQVGKCLVHVRTNKPNEANEQQEVTLDLSSLVATLVETQRTLSGNELVREAAFAVAQSTLEMSVRDTIRGVVKNQD
jgi:hypothetical protein